MRKKKRRRSEEKVGGKGVGKTPNKTELCKNALWKMSFSFKWELN